MPRVSIIMPTYNRADTITRAVQSVRAQSFEDWELVIVDDGSTDKTLAVLSDVDSRIRLIPKKHEGVAAARNRGLAEARGDLIAFLDSDDAWPAHHLALATAFFGAHPEEHLYSSEFWEDFGRGVIVRHFHVELADWFPKTAATIGSYGFAGPPPLGDGYLRVYESREEVGAWGRAVVEASGHRGVFHYRGRIFQGWRWGWLMALQPTVITRHALSTVGPFDASIPVANDFSWLALLCRRFPANYFSLPGAIKYEFGDAGRSLSEDHLASGKTAVQFHRDVLKLFEELFWSEGRGDPELNKLRGFRQYLVGEAAARRGEREIALAHLRASRETYSTWEARKLRWLVELAPSPELTRAAYQLSILPHRVKNKLHQLWTNPGRGAPTTGG